MSWSLMLLLSVGLGAAGPVADGASKPSDAPAFQFASPEARRIAAMIAAGRAEAALQAIRAEGALLDEFERRMLTGRACMALSRCRQAQDAFEAAARERPTSAQPRFELGRAFDADGNHALAIANFEKAADAGLDSAELHAAWARAYLGSGVVLGPLRAVRVERPPQPGERMGEACVAVRLTPEDRGECVVAGRDSAIFHACRAAELSPRRGDLLILLADTWAAGGLKEEAARTYARAAGLLPDAARAACLERWADCLLALRDHEGYFARLRESMALPGGLPAAKLADAYARVAQSMRDGGDAARQIRYLTFAAELQPASCERALALADALSASGRYPEAAEQWRQTLRLRPDHPRATELRRLIAELEQQTGNSASRGAGSAGSGP